MQIPIPDDWEGQAWRCVQIQWPDSPQWIALLVGFITQPTRGRFWDRRTGTITDAQAIGREIFDRNFPFNACAGIPNNGSNGDIPSIVGGGNFSDEEYDDMPGVTWLAIEDGVLYMYFGPCCKIAVDGAVVDAIQPPPTGTNEDESTPPTYACNKAYGIADSLATLAVDVVNAIDSFGNVYDMFQPTHKILSPHNSTWQTSQLVANAYFNNSAAVDAMIVDPDFVQWLACSWSSSLADTDNISNDEYYDMQTATYAPYGDGERLFITRMLQAVGRSTVAWWARLFYDNEADCTCPDYDPESTATEPTASGWYWSNELVIPMDAVGGFNGTLHSARQLLEHDYYGFAWRFERTSGSTLNTQTNRVNEAGRETGLAYDSYIFGTMTEYPALDTWYCQVDNTVWTSELDGQLPNDVRPTDNTGLYSGSVGSPNIPAGDVYLGTFKVVADGSDTTHIYGNIRVRVLYNENSASHQ